jgi:hypothetical protein
MEFCEITETTEAKERQVVMHNGKGKRFPSFMIVARKHNPPRVKKVEMLKRLEGDDARICLKCAGLSCSMGARGSVVG